MRIFRYLACAILGGMALHATADTIKLSTGVIFDGTVKERGDGILEVNSDGQINLFQKDEVVSIEPNAKTGAIDWNEVKARAAAYDADMLKKTGLDAAQRAAVDKLVAELPKDDENAGANARSQLVAMAKQTDIYPYLALLFAEASHTIGPPLLEVMAMVDPGRARKPTEAALTHEFHGMRAMALQLMGRSGDAAKWEVVARGLVDHSLEVRLAAAESLALLGARKSTPLLIESLTHPDLRVSNGCREALNAMWADKTGGKRLVTVDEWNTLWRGEEKNVGGNISLASLKPFVDEQQEFKNE